MKLAFAFLLLASAVSGEESFSANGRYAAVIHWPSAGTEPPPTIRVTMEEIVGDTHLAHGEMQIPTYTFDDVLVPDSGAFLVAVSHGRGGCTAITSADDDLVAIYRPDGTLVRALKVGDVANENDVRHLWSATVDVSLREDVIVLSIPAHGGKTYERRMDAGTGTLLDPEAKLYPSPRVWATPAGEVWRPEYAESACAPAIEGAVRIDSARLFAHAVRAPMPDIPPIVHQANIHGAFLVEVLVSESGDVLCARPVNLAFGGAAALEKAALQWKFEPFATRVAGELLFHLEELDDAQYAEATKNAPPPR